MVSGNIIWPNPSQPIWQFSYSLTSDPEGISIFGARYRGRQVLYKASLPSLRVQYDRECGPYKDPLTEGNAQVVPPSFSKVKVYTLYSGVRRIVLEAFHRIGNYRLLEKWTFTENGLIYPRLYSAGLQCNYDHRHHVYWRFDFDIEGSTKDLAFEYNSNTPNIGYGPGWHKKRVEIMRNKSPSFNRSWAILDMASWRGYFILPSPNDGNADSFSNHDTWFMRYRGIEDKRGNQGTAYSDDLSGYINGENIEGEDVVIWYCSHLHHHAAEGGDEWHWGGPTLAPFNW